MSKKFTLILFMLPLLALGSLPVFAQLDSAFKLTGAPSHIVTADAHLIPTSTGGDVTVELWVYVPVAQPDTQMFVSQGGANGRGPSGDDFYIGYANGTTIHNLIIGPDWQPNVSLPIGQWNHIAVVVDNGASNAWLYLNGVAVDSTVVTAPNSFFTPSGGAEFQLGTSTDSTLFFTGMIDGVRIWNVQRTAAQIKAGMYHNNFDPSDPLLTAWYQASEGSGTTSANSSATTGADLTLLNGATWATGPAIFGSNALSFDNTASTQVDIPANTAYDFPSGTIEADLQPGSLTGNAAFIANRGGGGSRWSIHMNNSFGNNLIGLYNNTQGIGFSQQYAPGFVSGTWYHVSLVTAPGPSGDTTAVYINGVYLSQIMNGPTPVGYDHGITGQPLTIGANGVNGSENWTGAIDEVRVWNTAFTQAQVISNMGFTLTGAEPNLAGVWNFDQGIADKNNAGLLVAVDNAPPTNNGILNTGFALSTGSASNFTAHIQPTLPVTFGKFTVTKQGTSALLQWQTYLESNTKDFIIERSGNGTTFTDIGSIAAAGSSNTLKNYTFTDNDPLEGNNYYRILERDLDLKANYSQIKALAFTKAGNLIWYSTGARSVEIRLQKGSTELYSITDVSGQVIRKGRLSGGTTTLTGVAGGIYFVKVINAAGVELNTKVLLP